MQPLKTKIVIVIDWYLPGFKAGGPTRTVTNMIALLSPVFDCFVLTRDRDLGENQPYFGIVRDTWAESGTSHVCYASDFSLTNLRRHVTEAQPDIVYLNSFFSRLTIKFLLLRRLKLIPPCPVVLAPRGEFAEAALGIKKKRKWVFLKTASRFLYQGILWHASTQHEALQIRKFLTHHGNTHAAEVAMARNIHIAADVPGVVQKITSDAGPLRKEPGHLRLVFLSRISKMKNLKYAIEACQDLQGEITFDIYGPLEDTDLWQECVRLIQRTQPNVRISYYGSVAPGEVGKILSQYHFFILPTLGENFGHVILEALSAGCPTITSDQTPWTDLEGKGIGWDLPLQERRHWTTILQRCVNMDQVAYEQMSGLARRFAADTCSLTAIREENINLFRHALEGWGPEKNALVASIPAS
jgi:glycosyltransferase involved in cell wall biosynthesis